ncbi:uncharacterized protein LOC134187259 [Corticium candelabrum]|uniref:uncharacterized protein LOC134187259 n=1 Tax=Corticium candelabrum TaxID=121492 RepID=UPI002E267F0B|nr:uncharacterized protein LOC134187259 [Corticium candelabrum]
MYFYCSSVDLLGVINGFQGIVHAHLPQTSGEKVEALTAHCHTFMEGLQTRIGNLKLFMKHDLYKIDKPDREDADDTLRVTAVNWKTGQIEVFTPKIRFNKLEFDLEYARLSQFPEEICETSGLNVLKLCTDDINSIPEGIAKLRKLEEIHLHTSDYHNSRTFYLSPRLTPIGLQEVPTVVSLLPCLKVLSVCGNRRNPLLFDELMSCQLPSTLVEVEMVECGLTQATLSMIWDKVKLCKVNLARNNLQSFKYCNTEMIREATVLNDLEELDLAAAS